MKGLVGIIILKGVSLYGLFYSLFNVKVWNSLNIIWMLEDLGCRVWKVYVMILRNLRIELGLGKGLSNCFILVNILFFGELLCVF